MSDTGRTLARKLAQQCKFNTPECCADAIYEAIVITRRDTLLEAADVCHSYEQPIAELERLAEERDDS